MWIKDEICFVIASNQVKSVLNSFTHEDMKSSLTKLPILILSVNLLI